MRLANAAIQREDTVSRRPSSTKRGTERRTGRNVKKTLKSKKRKFRSPEQDTITSDGHGGVSGEEVVLIAPRETRGENIVLEIKALLGICRDTPDSRELLSKLDDAHFHSEAAQMPFKRLRFLYARTGMIPDFQTLMNDPSVSAAARERLHATITAYDITAPATNRQFGGLFTAIDSYAKKRQVFEAINAVADVMRVDGTDAETAITRFKREALRLSSGFKAGTIHTTGGGADAGPAGSDLETVARRNLSHIDTLNPSGFNAYDKVNGGFPESGLIMFGADTGNFKSVMMLEHAIGQAKQGKRVAFYSLEMTESQLYDRVFANQISLDILKERREGTMLANIERNVKRVVEDMANWWPNWTLVCPGEDVSWEWIAEHASSTDAEIVYVDYIGLLSGTRGGTEAQWQALDSVTRNAKVYTNTTGRTVVLAAQMKFDEGRPALKYATAMKDHLNVLLAWEAIEVDGRTFLCTHVDKARGGKRFHYVMEVEPAFSRIKDIASNDKRGNEIAEQAIADMRARRDPAKRYQSVNDAKPHQTHSPEEDNRRTFDGVKVVGGGFTGKVKSYNVSPHDDANDEAPWETFDKPSTDNEKARASRREAMASVASSLSEHFAKQAERKAAQQSYMIDKRKALDALTKNKTAGLTRGQMALQAEELLKQWELGKAESTYGFDMLAKDIVAMQTSLGGLRQTVDAAKYPELALTLSNERDKRFAKRATPEERELHRKRMAFVKAAIEKRDAKRKARDKLRIADLIFEAPSRLANDGTNLFDVADPFTLTRDWTINAVTFEDRAASTIPNSAKPVAKRWKLDPRNLTPANARVAKYRPVDHAKLVQLRWPKVEALHYLTDAQLDHMVQLTNKWNGVPLAHVIDQPDYRQDMIAWATFVTPANSKSRSIPQLTEKAYAAIAAKYQAPSGAKESKDGRAWKESPLAARYGKALAKTYAQRLRERVREAYSTAPAAISYRKVAA